MEELNTMLARLSSEGDADSSGVFTLSLEKAGEKLATYRLASPGLFVLNLVASAVMAGAQQFTIETTGEVTLFAFDTVLEPELEPLEGLLSTIFDPKASPFVRELALAVHGARSLPDQPKIIVSVSTQQWSRDLVVSAEKIDMVVAEARPSGVIFQLQYRSGWRSLFSRGKGVREEAVRHFSHFCRFAPLKVINNGQVEGARVTGGLYESSIMAWRHLQGEQAMNVAVPKRSYDLTLSQKKVSPTVSSMVVSLHEPNWARQQGLLLLSRGVAFRRPLALLGCPLALVVITADHLEKNLSQSDLVENDDYHLIIEAAKAEVEDLISEVCSSPPLSWRPNHEREFSLELERRYPAETPAPLVVEAYRRLKQMTRLCQQPEGQQQQIEFWRRLSEEEPDRAERFHRELTEALQASLKRSIASRQWSQSLPTLTSLTDLGVYRADSLLVALRVLSDDPKGARELLTSTLPGYSSLLESLITGRSSETVQGPMADLLAFQRAVEADELVLADELRNVLMGYEGTPLLDLWLGWYSIYRRKMDQACIHWDQAVTKVNTRDWAHWNEALWEELNGKVSFLHQVRWRARRGLEELQLAFLGEREKRIGGGESLFPIDWASAVWRSHLNSRRTQGQELFRNGYLMSLINPESLSLEPLDSTISPLAFFHKTL